MVMAPPGSPMSPSEATNAQSELLRLGSLFVLRTVENHEDPSCSTISFVGYVVTLSQEPTKVRSPGAPGTPDGPVAPVSPLAATSDQSVLDPLGSLFVLAVVASHDAPLCCTTWFAAYVVVLSQSPANVKPGPVAPVAPVGPVSPVAPVEPVAPVAP